MTVGGDRKATYRLIGALVAGLLIGAFVVLTVTGAFCDSDSGDSGASAGPALGVADGGSGDGSGIAAANSDRLTQAVLSPVDGGDASGRALFGRLRDAIVLQVEAEGLEPSPPGQSYAVWLYRSPQVVLRIGAVRVGESGGIAAQFPIPAQVLAYVASGAFDRISLSLTPDGAYEAEVAKAKTKRGLPTYTGIEILSGKITGPVIRAGAGG